MLVAAKLGWMLDAMDFMVYAMAIGRLKTYFGFNDATAGLLGTVTLATSALGGLIFGVVADRCGRTRALMGTILIFSLASLGAATSQSVAQLLMWRAVLGIGMGGERGAGQRDVAAGASQQSDQHRAIGLGDRLHPGRRDGRADSRVAPAWFRLMAVALRRWRVAGAVDSVGAAQR